MLQDGPATLVTKTTLAPFFRQCSFSALYCRQFCYPEFHHEYLSPSCVLSSNMLRWCDFDTSFGLAPPPPIRSPKGNSQVSTGRRSYHLSNGRLEGISEGKSGKSHTFFAWTFEVGNVRSLTPPKERKIAANEQ